MKIWKIFASAAGLLIASERVIPYAASAQGLPKPAAAVPQPGAVGPQLKRAIEPQAKGVINSQPKSTIHPAQAKTIQPPQPKGAIGNPAFRPQGAENRAVIEADYSREFAKIEKVRLERLARLAASQPPAEAEATLEDYFRIVIANGLYQDAERTAEAVLKGTSTSPQVRSLAALVNMVAEANRGAYQESLDSLMGLIRINDKAQSENPGVARPVAAIPISTRLSLIDAYYQRLVQGEQFEIARKAMAMVSERTDSDEIKSLVSGRIKQLDLVGKPAPPIVGTDLDGNAVNLAENKGQVVLVIFWASWYRPAAEDATLLNRIQRVYSEKGFRILGINVDTAADGGQTVEAVLPAVHRFLLDHNVSWTNLINGEGEADYAKAFSVDEIPATFLVGRDGRVVHLDLTRSNFEKAISQAVTAK